MKIRLTNKTRDRFHAYGWEFAGNFRVYFEDGTHHDEHASSLGTNKRGAEMNARSNAQVAAKRWKEWASKAISAPQS